MPDPLSLADVRRNVDTLTLPQLERYLRGVLSPAHDHDVPTIARNLFGARGDPDREGEFASYWNSLRMELERTAQVVDDLDERSTRKREERLSREAGIRINLLRDENVESERSNGLLRQRMELERSIDKERAGLTRRDLPIDRSRGADFIADRPLDYGPQDPPSSIPSAQQPKKYPFSPESVSNEGVDAAMKTALAAADIATDGMASAAKLAGRGLLGGLRLGGRGLKAAGGATARGVGGMLERSGDVPLWHLWAMFLVGLLSHAYVFFLVSDRLNLGLTVAWALCMALLYWALSGLANESFDGSGIRDGLIYSAIAALLYLSAGWIGDLSLASQVVIDSWRVFVIIVPVWPVAMWARAQGYNPSSWTSKLFRLYLLALVLLIIGFVIWPILGSSAGLITISSQRIDVGDTFSGFYEAFHRTWERIFVRVDTITKTYTNPDYYTGRVDQNKDKPLGVTISDVRPLDAEIANDSQMTVFANVETKSFFGEQAQVVPACVIDRSDAPAASSLDPAMLDLVYGTTGSFECSFDAPNGGWRRGAYSVTASATFPFQTWAYLTYAFVDEETARNIARQGNEVRKVLGVDQHPEAIYTTGPVALGMGGTDQPILVRLADDKNGWIAPGSRVGVSLSNAWQDGRISAVQAIELKVPEGFALTGCDRPVTRSEADPNAPGYTSYVFENPPDDALAVDYLTLTCKLGLESQEAAASLVSTGDLAERTIIAVARYEYTTDKKTSVRVR